MWGKTARKISLDKSQKCDYLTGMMVDAKDISRLANRLKKVQVKYAVLNTLNDIAALADKAQREQLGKEFVLRNKYTLGSLRTSKARLSKLQSEAGSIQGYLAKQETGGTKTGKGGGGANVPTNFASNLPDGGVRNKPVVVGKRMLNLKHIAVQLQTPANQTGGSKAKQAAAMARRLLKKTGAKYIYSSHLGTKGKTGIYRLQPGKSWLKMVHDLTNPVIIVKRTNWHEDSILSLRLPRLDIFYRRLDEQLKSAR